jgi:hypothetical protein
LVTIFLLIFGNYFFISLGFWEQGRKRERGGRERDSKRETQGRKREIVKEEKEGRKREIVKVI